MILSDADTASFSRTVISIVGGVVRQRWAHVGVFYDIGENFRYNPEGREDVCASSPTEHTAGFQILQGRGTGSEIWIWYYDVGLPIGFVLPQRQEEFRRPHAVAGSVWMVVDSRLSLHLGQPGP